jgi:hypothetical protein
MPAVNPHQIKTDASIHQSCVSNKVDTSGKSMPREGTLYTGRRCHNAKLACRSSIALKHTKHKLIELKQDTNS